MDSTPLHAALLYLLTFRLAIIGVGGMSIFLGYLLFVQGLFPGGKRGSEGTSLDAKLGEATLSLKNAAPGAVFALFGAVMVGAMVVSDPPGFVKERKSDGQASSDSVTVRANEGWGQLEKSDRQIIADELHRKAYDYGKEGKTKEALRLADYATRLDPDDANLWDTLAGFHAGANDYPQAASAVEQAVKLEQGNACYQQRLAKYRQGLAAEDCAALPRQ